jgi:uncharacterized protein DUF1843
MGGGASPRFFRLTGERPAFYQEEIRVSKRRNNMLPTSQPFPPSPVPYGPPPQDVIAEGDLQQLKRLARQAEECFERGGTCGGSLGQLRAEIARLERK